MLISGIATTTNTAITFYPNPADKTLYIGGIKNANINSIILYSATGQVVQYIHDTKYPDILKIDLSMLTEGIYLIELNSGKDKIRTRVVVRHD